MFVQDKIDSDLNQEEKLLTLNEFLDWYPDGYKGRFELHNGVIVSTNFWIGTIEELKWKYYTLTNQVLLVGKFGQIGQWVINFYGGVIADEQIYQEVLFLI